MVPAGALRRLKHRLARPAVLPTRHRWEVRSIHACMVALGALRCLKHRFASSAVPPTRHAQKRSDLPSSSAATAKTLTAKSGHTMSHRSDAPPNPRPAVPPHTHHHHHKHSPQISPTSPINTIRLYPPTPARSCSLPPSSLPYSSR